MGKYHIHDNNIIKCERIVDYVKAWLGNISNILRCLLWNRGSIGEYHIHGDNIIECERIVDYVKAGLTNVSTKYGFRSPACVKVLIEGIYQGEKRCFEMVLFPGFNKTSLSRWNDDIYSPIKEAGGFLDETPDAVISYVEDGYEEILLAVEFCSALQAGNQAWQRSGRAASTARSGCPYLYIVDFLKFELDTNTRERKNIRYPNPAIPYSYINYSFEGGIFCSQVYVKAEEFQPSLDSRLSGFDEEYFAESELSEYIVRKMLFLNTDTIENALLEKCFNVVKFLSRGANAQKNFTELDWQNIFEKKEDVVEYSVVKSKFSCSKSIAKKSAATNSVVPFKDLVKKYSRGIGSQDLPMGVVPSPCVASFLNDLRILYPSLISEINQIDANKDLIVALIKGFKPGGDDNRPDRGLLPLIAMLGSSEHQVITFLYGPILNGNLNLLLSVPIDLANRNGLWKSIISLSDFILLNAPVLGGSRNVITELVDNRKNKEKLLAYKSKDRLVLRSIDPTPRCIQEDDADTALHVLLSKTGTGAGFECMCNPPGGDWSGMSIFSSLHEYRWLSLPRVSHGDRKRPDHITEYFGIADKPLLLVTESKGKGADLEPNVGNRLIVYVEWLMNFVPSVKRERGASDWTVPNKKVISSDYFFVSAGAYIEKSDDDIENIHSLSCCDLLFGISPSDVGNGWNVSLYAFTEMASLVANHIASTADATLFRVKYDKN